VRRAAGVGTEGDARWPYRLGFQARDASQASSASRTQVRLR
jgi:hypothetical protein